MKKLHKKLLAMLLATGMTLSLFGCAAETPEQTEAAPVIAIPEPEQDNKCTDYGTPLADLRIRRALAHAIDMDTIVEALFFGDAVNQLRTGWTHFNNTFMCETQIVLAFMMVNH